MSVRTSWLTSLGRHLALIALAVILPLHGRAARFPESMAGTVERTLPNGLRLIVREQHGAALVAIDVWVRAGSGREEQGESGAAHFLEHVIFKGTPTFKPGEIDAAIEDLGATANAGTMRDGAHFYTTVATPYLESALSILADAVRNASLAPEEVERERTVILDEVARAQNDLHKQALDSLYAALYAKHPYRNPVLGLPDNLKRISRDSVAGFYKRLYAPNSVTVVLVGDVTPDAAQALATKLFGDWPKREVPPPPPDESETKPPADGQHAEESPKPALVVPAVGRSAAVAIGFPVMSGENAAEVYTADVLAALLDDEAAGRLTKALKQPGLATQVAADVTTLRGPSIFALYAATTPERILAVRRALEEEMRRLQREPVPADEIEFAKRRLVGTYLFDIETYAGQARMLGIYDVISDYKRAMDYADGINKVTGPDLLAFAQRYFAPSSRAEVVFTPQGKGAE